MIRDPQGMVREFHEAFDCLRSDTPILDPDEIRARMKERLAIFEEEVAEYIEARESGDPVAVAHEMADVAYVLFGDAVALGVDVVAVMVELHRANMTKLWPDGRPRYRESDGKVLKPPGFRPADVATVLGGARLDVTGPVHDGNQLGHLPKLVR